MVSMSKAENTKRRITVSSIETDKNSIDINDFDAEKLANHIENSISGVPFYPTQKRCFCKTQAGAYCSCKTKSEINAPDFGLGNEKKISISLIKSSIATLTTQKYTKINQVSIIFFK